MKKTNKMATIRESTRRGTYKYYNRRVFEDENGIYFIRINGNWFTVSYLESINHRVELW